ncbi:translation initiation factor IF-2 [Putridiphycobacter roseus]|uniref:Translation initiation factor IF-2 n=1 Tax=Putridiphycobacter roseus TaxID=2219161 RepID=A0A2W1N2E0_9FLAO|nr:translation initiation factor IF-2 [Putridiphycobacter roseus]PZE18829.1 translation initiation factor IF-2 [Putridiphycobacter roseus]
MAGTAKRLNKVAREFNVSISTIVDFLASNGHEIDSKPNTKIEGEVLSILEQEFAADKTAKEKSQQASVKREKRETISLEDVKAPEDKEEHKPEVEEAFDVATFKSSKAAKDALENAEAKKSAEAEKAAEKAAAEAEEASKKAAEVAAAEKVAEEKRLAEEKAKSPIQENPEVIESGDLKVSVVGKIDLSSINQKTRPDKKKKPAPAPPAKVEKEAIKPKAEPAKTAAKVEKAKVTKKPEVKKPEKKEEKKPNVIENYVTKTEKLTGPTVIGKIVLPVEKKRSDSKKEHDDKRKKRKRIKKVNVDTNKSNTPNSNAGNGRGPRGNNAPGGHGKRGPRVEKAPVTEAEIQKEIKETLARLQGGGKKKGAKFRREKRDMVAQRREEELEQQELEKGILKLTEFVTVSELASMMNVSATEVIGSCMSLGIFASINQRLDAETIQLVASDFGFETEFISAEVQEAIVEEEDKPEDLLERAPIVTVMGHVDHGKTSLLDYIRNASVTAGEAGGITQHIGAYSVTGESGRKITFLDTPGHEAFTAMRARGAQVTDIAIIIVAADDDVMPQTKEAISHAQAAGVPMVFAINKIDKPGANPDKIKEQLSQMNILVEEWGGKFQSQEISAKNGVNIEELLEKVLLEAEILELKANPNKTATGTVVEASLDKGRGYVTTVLVSAGTLKIGDFIIAGQHYGKVKAMNNDKGEAVTEAGPSIPVSILGFNGAPSAGDSFNVLLDEREAKQIAVKREQLKREQGLRTKKHLTLDEIGRRLAVGDFQELNVIVKGDVDGSIEALSDSLEKLSTEEIQVNIIHKAVGQISETDVTLAAASNAIIVGFQVRPSQQARKLAESEGIDIRLYSVIYKAIDEIKEAMEGMLSPDIKEEILGTAEIRETFKITKVGTIAGCFVTDGVINRKSKVRLIRDGIVVYTGDLDSLKRFKDDVKEVKRGYECGLSIAKYNDLREGDIVEAYHEVEVAKKL